MNGLTGLSSFPCKWSWMALEQESPGLVWCPGTGDDGGERATNWGPNWDHELGSEIGPRIGDELATRGRDTRRSHALPKLHALA